MKTNAQSPNPPAPAKMADELLLGSSQMILDYYSATQGRRVLKMMQAQPTELLAEMWQALQRLKATAWEMAKARQMLVTENGRTTLNDPVRSELMNEAFQSLFPAVPTPEADELTPAQQQTLDAWLESIATAA